MKNSRGDLLLPLWWGLVVLSMLHGEDFRFDLRTDTHTPYLKAPVHIEVDLNQTNHDVVLLYRFSLKPSADYKVIQIDGVHDDTLYHTHHHYRYELYPLKTGDINVTFAMTKRVTDEQKVAYSASGDRDDFKKLQTKDYAVTLPPLQLHVKPLPEKTQLVGKYVLEATFGTDRAKAFSPIPLKVTITGKGYPPKLTQILPPIEGVKIFAEEPHMEQFPSSEGITYKATYTLALSAKESFTLPEVKLRAFDPQSSRPYTLTIPQKHFEITPVDVNSLVDKVDTPPSLKNIGEGILSWLGYLLAFAAGVLSAKLIKLPRTNGGTQPHPLEKKIDACGDKRILLRLLLAYDAQRFTSVIEKLEQDLYGNGSHPIKQLKREAKEQLT